MKTDVVVDLPCRTGEGPLWDPDARCVYWTDIPSGALYRWQPDACRAERVYAGRPVGGFTLQPDGALLLFRDHGNVVIWRDGAPEETVCPNADDPLLPRFNDVCADAAGRVYCGTMSGPERSGRLCRLDTDGTLHVLSDGWGTPNGMGFTPDRRQMFYNDSNQARTWHFDVDPDTGALSEPRLFRDAVAQNDPGRPDGLALDRDGGVWTARWDGGALLRFDPVDGRCTDRIDLPVHRASSLCFAGDDLSEIYVTTAGGDHRPALGQQAGALFRIRDSGFVGAPRHRSRVKVA